MNRQKVAGRSFGPIIQLDEGETVLLVVTDVRHDVGPYKSAIVGCSTLNGTEVSLNGHAVLIDKLERSEQMFPAPFIITRAGSIETQAGSAKDYQVEAVLDSLDDIRADKEGKQMIAETEKIVEAHVDALPPRN